MRAYFFGNTYLSSIQHGIQAAHVLGEMVLKYENSTGLAAHDLYDWMEQHKTVVLLTAGFSSEILDLIHFFGRHENPYAWAEFYEDPKALGSGGGTDPLGALTSVGIVLPDRIYETAKLCRSGGAIRQLLNTPAHTKFVNADVPNDLTEWEIEMIDRLPKYSLAK